MRYLVLVLAVLVLLAAPGLIWAQACPPDTVISDSFVGTEPTMPDRLLRDAVPSVCAPPKAFPGTLLGPVGYKTAAYANTGTQDACVRVDYNEGDCSVNIHMMAYLNSFDPNNLATNYLGDTGSSFSASFEFEVPAGNDFVIVTQTNFDPVVTCDYSYTISNVPCQAVQVPAMTNWGMILFIVFAGLGSVYFLVRRKRRA